MACQWLAIVIIYNRARAQGENIMVKLTFKSHDNTETKEVKGFSWNMLPSGSFIVKKGYFTFETISCLKYYLAKVQEE